MFETMPTYTIVYKSGVKVYIEADGFEVTRFATGEFQVKWDKMEPKPFLLHPDEIESIWKGKI